MPLALVTHAERVPRRRFVDVPSGVADWQLLHRYADQLFPELRTVWATLFAEARTTVDMAALREALARGNALDVERILMDAWQTEVARAARLALPVLIRETVTRTAAALLPAVTRAAPELLSVQFTMAAPEVLAAIDEYVGRQIVAIQRSTLLAVRTTIRQGFAEGHGVARMARDLRTVLGLTPRQARAVDALRTRLEAEGIAASAVQRQTEQLAQRALRRRAVVIARTESIAAASLGQQEIFRTAARQGLWDDTRLKRVWLVTPDDRLCSICRAIPGMNRGGVGLEEPFITTIGPVLTPPAHPSCVTGDTLVTAGGRIAAVSERIYQGNIILIGTATGQHLTCTPNHPILTDRGWISAGFLHPGRDLLCTCRQEGMAAVNHDIGHMPTLIEEIAEAFRLTAGMLPCIVPVTTPDFHGDGEGSQVAVIRTNGLLRNWSKSLLDEHLSEQRFQARSKALRLLSRQGNLHAMLKGVQLTRGGVMRGENLFVTFLLRHLLPLETFSLALRASQDSMLSQNSRNHPAGDMEMFRQRILRGATHIQFDRLQRIERRYFRGHVYNLHTELGWYSASNIITHNCRCAVRPRVGASEA